MWSYVREVRGQPSHRGFSAETKEEFLVVGVCCVVGDAVINISVIMHEDVWCPEEGCGDW